MPDRDSSRHETLLRSVCGHSALKALTVSNLNHPDILTADEFDQTDSVAFIATE